jgi:hypothetical protein
MNSYVNKSLGFILVTKKVPDHPFICLTLMMRCACCGSFKPQVVTTMGMN